MRQYMSVFNKQRELLWYGLPMTIRVDNLDIHGIITYAKWKLDATQADVEAMDAGDMSVIHRYTRMTISNPNTTIKGYKLLWWLSRFSPQQVDNFKLNEIFYDRIVHVLPTKFDPNQPLIWWSGRVLEGYEVKPYTGKWA
jgi:hypothetical protein